MSTRNGFSLGKLWSRVVSGLVPDRAKRHQVRAILLPSRDAPANLRESYVGPECERPFIEVRRGKVPRAEDVLNRHAGDVHSQWGEDGILEHIFAKIGVRERYGVEFGAWDGKHLSNLYNLVANHSWRALMIEGNAEKFPALCRTAAEVDGRIEAVHGCVGVDKYPKLDAYLEKCPANLDLLSIDVDGIDYYIWESLETRRPRVVVIEFNMTVPANVVFVQARNESINEGASALALVELAGKKGYSLAAVTTTNLIFVADEDFPKLGIEDNRLESLWLEPAVGAIFNVYSGKIYTAGMDRLWWTGAPVSHEALQLHKTFRWGDSVGS